MIASLRTLIVRLRLSAWRALNPARHRWMPESLWHRLQPQLNLQMMARMIGAGIAEIWSVPTIANLAAPEAGELNAGTDLTGFLTDGGIDTPLDGSQVDIADMSSAYNKTQAGTYGGQALTIEAYRDDATDTAWTSLARDTVTNIAIARKPLATKSTWAIGDEVEIWPVTVISRNPAPIVRNEAQKFTAECSVNDEPTLDFSIAA